MLTSHIAEQRRAAGHVFRDENLAARFAAGSAYTIPRDGDFQSPQQCPEIAPEAVLACTDGHHAWKLAGRCRYWQNRIGLPAAVAIRDALARAGRDPCRLGLQDIDFLSRLDEFHCLGTQATIDLARLAEVGVGARVLDIGSGIGGPSRRLSATLGCDVVGLDITRDYVTAATLLAERIGLSPRVSYHWGDAVDLPFPPASFDIAWVQVASANIFDRERLYREIRRVLRPSGRAAFFEILEGPGGPLRFPVPWAVDPSTSALLTPPAMIATLAHAGLHVSRWRDVSTEAANWFRHEARLSRARRPLSFEVLLPDWGRMAVNQWLNLIERRIFFVYVVAEPD
jgi:MPBQ/MSBQ methyltransferase